jgi:hypothetical protein
MQIKKAAVVYQKLILTINKIERGFVNKPFVMELSETKELISEIDSVMDDFARLERKLHVIKNKTRMSYTEILSPVHCFEWAFDSLSSIMKDCISLICAVFHNLIFYNDHEINLNTYMVKKIIFQKIALIDGYKDVVNELQIIEEMVFKKVLVNDDILLSAIEKVESHIHLILEGIEIVRSQRKFSYYDIVLIMTRFYCGLTESLFIVEEIKYRARELGYAIYDQQVLVESQENNNSIGVKK